LLLFIITIEAFVEKVRPDGKLDISFRPQDSQRIAEQRAMVLDALEGSPTGYIPIG